jgi:hypothetical protein
MLCCLWKAYCWACYEFGGMGVKAKPVLRFQVEHRLGRPDLGADRLKLELGRTTTCDLFSRNVVRLLCHQRILTHVRAG